MELHYVHSVILTKAVGRVEESPRRSDAVIPTKAVGRDNYSLLILNC